MAGRNLPTVILRLEGVALLAVAVYLYARYGDGWVLFALLILAPDLSLLGYTAGPAVGAAAYNVLHTTVLPLALGVVGIVAGSEVVLSVALVWLAHIGMDRGLGYGLKLMSGFRDTHLGRFGRD
ncbi:MAG: DUF4260 domain-containing protein [Actinomycetota bacterium]